ncbi:M20/M25/M40 family metallo-hydrolase [Kribbella shirazensis]|uniref:Acetylornithine deacetylase/succinyl-diaminopimelate desuccinylase-like protein n=1 Tax=Kribbella shirazensis TaxID=1105143 RepID=A0A7X5VHQ6_9ACTN|nr:M20/M25/M40 family metallo-hydrolase [Kribbella shirazensis]NIK61515.1 acetylornithine deacetylase/succinyl-diaminopimelate desuccinylase-like protein [Kribbella shirazensis]
MTSTVQSSPLSDRVDAVLPKVLADLAALVSIPSVSSSPAHESDVRRSAEASASLLESAGLSAEVVAVGGHPSVIAHRAGPAGAPTVLLYAHHDVQPAGDPARWDSPPFEATYRGDRLVGRGAADDKAGLAVHLAAVLAHGNTLPVSVTVLVDGEEEIGSPTLADLITTHRDRLAAEVIVIADSVNWAVGVPALTISLRGVLELVVEVRTLDHPLHSGAWGGAVPDALMTLIATLASLHNPDGSVAVGGLVGGSGATVDYDLERFRADAGLLDDVTPIGTGALTDRLWNQPSITVTGLDAPAVDGAAGMLSAIARAKISIRLAPGDDPEHAEAALLDHLRFHLPFGAHLTVTRGASAHPANVTAPHDVRTAALQALQLAWNGTAPVEIGCGGTLPLIHLFHEAFPEAAILVTGVEDPDTRAHGPNESLHLKDFRNACLAEAHLLRLLAHLSGCGQLGGTEAT